MKRDMRAVLKFPWPSMTRSYLVFLTLPMRRTIGLSAANNPCRQVRWDVTKTRSTLSCHFAISAKLSSIIQSNFKPGWARAASVKAGKACRRSPREVNLIRRTRFISPKKPFEKSAEGVAFEMPLAGAGGGHVIELDRFAISLE